MATLLATRMAGCLIGFGKEIDVEATVVLLSLVLGGCIIAAAVAIVLLVLVGVGGI